MIDPNELPAVLDSMLEGLQILGPDWRYLHVNEVAAAHGRSSKEHLLGQSILDCYPGIEHTAVFAAMRSCMTERAPRVMENEFTYPDGSKAWFELRIQPVPPGICVLSIDVSARKLAEADRVRAEVRLQQAQRLESIGILATGIAHDFNNLLTVVLGQAEIALSRATGPQVDDMETIALAARSAAELTRQLLAYGRRSVQTNEVVDLREVIDGLETILLRSLPDRIELVLDIDRAVDRVDIDRVHLEQIVMNLVVNARDAIPGRGRITVAIDRADYDSEFVLMHPELRVGPHTVLVVRDTGVGMDESTQARVFEPFFSTKERGRGTGLGLATVHGIVKQAGGSIQVRSAPGSGSTFTVQLPSSRRVATAAPPAPAVAKAEAPPPSRILVVDDHREIAELMQLMLALDAHDVAVATSGEQALSMWRERRPGFDLMITDYSMPGMSGRELIDLVRQDRPQVPVLCTSADAQVLDRAGVAFLEKPFTRAQLRTVVGQLLGAAVG